MTCDLPETLSPSEIVQVCHRREAGIGMMQAIREVVGLFGVKIPETLKNRYRSKVQYYLDRYGFPSTWDNPMHLPGIDAARADAWGVVSGELVDDNSDEDSPPARPEMLDLGQERRILPVDHLAGETALPVLQWLLSAALGTIKYTMERGDARGTNQGLKVAADLQRQIDQARAEDPTSGGDREAGTALRRVAELQGMVKAFEALEQYKRQAAKT